MANETAGNKPQRTVKCRKCGTEAVKSSALGKEFWYCRNCKVEVEETPSWSGTFDHATTDALKQIYGTFTIDAEQLKQFQADIDQYFWGGQIPSFSYDDEEEDDDAEV
jgi:ribosomal protein L37AE/L43A